MLKINVLKDVRGLLASEKANDAEWKALQDDMKATCVEAFEKNDADSLRAFHEVLFELYHLNFIDPKDPKAQNQFHPEAIRLRNEMETAWTSYLNAQIADMEIDVPADGAEFVKWMLKYMEAHPVNQHPLYDYLQEKGTFEDFQIFFQSELVVNRMFEEFIAFTQMGAPILVKVELAKNYWDEMGNGKAHKVHTAMFDKLLNAVNVENLDIDHVAEANPIALAQANLFLMSSIHKKNFYQMMGTIAAGEYLVPKRYGKIVDGARRNGISDDALEFYIEHITVDTSHAEDWLEEAVVPTISDKPEIRQEIARGAYMRMMHIQWFSDTLYKRFVK